MSSRRLGHGPSNRPANTPNPPRGLVGQGKKPGSRGAVSKSQDPTEKTNDARDRPMSRIPLNRGVRRPSNSSQPTRPAVHRQGQSWGSTGSGSARSGSIGGSSGSSASAREPSSKPDPSLRMKHSNVVQNPERTRNHSRSDSARTGSSSSNPSGPQNSTDRPTDVHYDRALTESPAEIRVAQAVDVGKATSPTVKIYPELDRYREIQRPAGSSDSELPYKLTTNDLTPPTPGYISGAGSQLSTMSGSPSTRFSESPGTGPYSRDTTPTSVSSQSPSLVVPVRFAPPGMQRGSPGRTRPPVTRRRGPSISNGTDILNADSEGLATVRESLTSSSSNSTVRGADTKAQKKAQAPPISPPLRKSSAHQADKVQSPEPTTRKLTHRPTHPAVASPPPAMTNAGRRIPATSPRATPPMRPSRENTPDMQSQLWEPVPVVQSNLSSTSLPGERRGSESHAWSASNSRSTTPSGHADRARPIHRRQPSGQERASSRQDDSGKESADAKRRKPGVPPPARTPSPNVSTFSSRFPFFGRKKSAPTPEATSVGKQEKQARKGPAAGTGHEGYGRLGAIRRRSSGLLNPSRGSFRLAPPQENPRSTPQFTDPFLHERMKPVVISGGEVVENRNTSDSEPDPTESYKSFIPGHSRQRSSDSRVSSKSGSSREEGRKTLWPSAFPKSQQTSSMPRRGSESSDGGTARPSLAFRRSTQRLRTSPGQGPMRLPKPINTSGTAPSPLTSFDTTTTSDDLNTGLQRETSRGSKPNFTQPKKLTKRPRSPRKWNFFSRSQPQAKASPLKVEEVAATVTVVQSKQVPYYAMMDSSEQEDGGDIDVMDVLRNAEVYDVPHGTQDPEPETMSLVTRPPELAPSGDDPGRLNMNPPSEVPAPEPEIRVTSLLPASTREQAPQQAEPSRGTKRNRLPRVGRIPKVVSPRPNEASPRSFSRPFNKTSPQIPTTTTDQPNQKTTTISPNLPKLSTPELTLHSSSVMSGSQEPSASSALVGEGREFLAFSPRKDSTTTTSSSRCSGLSTMADTTAVIPSPSAPLVEDEIWDEYNDLLGDIAMKPPLSTAKPKVRPLSPVKTGGSKAAARNESLESPTIVMMGPGLQVDKSKPEKTREKVVSSVYSCDDEGDEVDLLSPSLAEINAATSFSVSKSVASHGERNNSGEPGKPSAEDSQRDSERNSGASHRSRDSSNSTSSKTSEEDTPLAQVNLRVGSMTVSKWLTFGHVLFSPAREELGLSKGTRESYSVLVIDGLGNDDWSFYAAETYPDATFFNLSPRAPLPRDRRSSTTLPHSPPNHYQIQYASHLAKFPFGPETFSTVVFRFPTAAPESHYRNIVAEARRVLKPGGYMELSILDVDLNNMGNRGRRAVRRLKERIHARSNETNLASTADLMLRLLGRKKFVDIKSCRVGVPVASSIAKGLGSGVSKGKGREQRSLAEMMNDDSELADENIAKMVSKVARWWYTRCYESVAPPAGGTKKGMWDKALLAECEEWGTSLKLMVCHARAPDRGNRVASI